MDVNGISIGFRLDINTRNTFPTFQPPAALSYTKSSRPLGMLFKDIEDGRVPNSYYSLGILDQGTISVFDVSFCLA